MDWRVLVILLLEAALAFYLVRREVELGAAGVALCIFFTAAAFTLRGLCLNYETLDFIDFLSPWVTHFRVNGGFSALSSNVGNYNVPYLYFLALFSYSDIYELYLIKELSILFDVLLAWSAMRLAGLYIKSPSLRVAVFFSILFLPTVVLNGSLWAQCDSTYAFWAVLALYLALSDRPVPSMVSFAISFGFKLQAVFILPVIAVLWFYGKYNWKHFLVFPLAYALLVLPAVLAGRPFLETLTLYANQTGSIGSGLNYNSPSIFAIFDSVPDESRAAAGAVYAAFGYMLAVLLASFLLRKRLTVRSILFAALLLSAGIPFLLPHMHDRYFFLTDILTVVLAFTVPELSICAPLAQFASLLGYHAYLKMRYLLLMYWGSYALIAVLLLSASGFALSLAEHPPSGQGQGCPSEQI